MANHEGDSRDELPGENDAAQPTSDEGEQAGVDAPAPDDAEADDAGEAAAPAGDDVVIDAAEADVDETDDADEPGTDIAEVDEDRAAGGQSRRHLVRQKAKKVSTKQRVRRVLVRSGIAVVIVAALVAAGIWIKQNVVAEVTEPVAQPENIPDGAFAFDGRDLSSMYGPEADDQGADDEKSDAKDSDKKSDSKDSGETSDAKDSEEKSGAKDSDEKSSDGSDEPKRVRVDVYVDYLSPESGVFQESNSAQLASWVDEGAISLTYHPVALLTSKSNGTRYSQRAMGAAACVASNEPDGFVAFNQELLFSEPEPDTAGYTSEKLADLAEGVGIDSAKVRSCIEGDTYAAWARDLTNDLSEGSLPDQGEQQLTGVPLILISGIPYTGALDDPGELSQFVLTVESDEYFQTPTPEPSE